MFNRMLTHLLRKEINLLAAPFGLTIDRLNLLELACRGRRTQADLARALRVTKSVVNIMVGALEERGFVQREPILGDRRAFHVVPTAHGRATFEAYARRSVAIELEARAKARIEVEARLQHHFGALKSVPKWD
ncbi:hypothetical protein BH09MYX1_BH09MYX1_66990 [soil metagenome]